MNIVYLRVSTNEQDVDAQLKQCLAIIDEFKLKNYKEYKEIQSAYKDELRKRPKFSKILTLIKKGKVRNFIVWDLDRIYRNRAKLLEFFELCKHYNCTVLSYRQKFLNEIESMKLPEGFGFMKEIMLNMFRQILGWLAEEESTKHSARIKKAVVKRKGFETQSKKGNRWGMLPLVIDIDKVLKLSKDGFSSREIANKILAKKPDGTFTHPSYVTITTLLKRHKLLVGKTENQLNKFQKNTR